jgi:choline dehydrogenase
MSASLFLENEKVIKLRQGTYSVKKLDLKCRKIVKICLKAQSSIVISSCDDTIIYSKENDSEVKVCEVVCLKLKKDAKITVQEVCNGDLPCENEKWDYIIVGEGAAGAILARFLSNDNKTRVLAIESGISHQDDPVVLTPNWINVANDLLYNPTYGVNYPIPLAPLSSQSYSEGIGRGGSSSHNFLQYVLPTPALLDSWAEISGNPSWSYDNMKSLIKVLETYTPDGTIPDYAVRGKNGFISVTQNPPVNVGNEILNAFNSVTNVPYTSDYNNPLLGVLSISAIQQLFTPGPNSIRSYADRVLLRDGVIVDANGNGLNGRKLKILTNARVTNLDIDNTGRATGVKYIFSDQFSVIKNVKVSKKGTIILTAGALNTPKILLQSGVGPKSDLEALGIEVKVDSPNVGKNLQNQYGTEVLFGANIPNFAQLFIDVLNKGRREVQLTAIDFGPTLTAVLPAILNPTGRGQVSIVTQNTFFQPKVSMSVYENQVDIDIGVEMFKIAKRVADLAGVPLFFPPPDHFPAPLGPAPDNSLLVADLKDPRYLILQSHIVGTCRMAKSINDGVVDGELKVFGLQNVRIGDASIQPISSDGNTCAPVYLSALNLLRLLGVPLILN